MMLKSSYSRHADVIQIQKHAERGGRLVCTEPVGYLRSNTTNTQYGGKCIQASIVKSSASNVRYRSDSIYHVSSYNMAFKLSAIGVEMFFQVPKTDKPGPKYTYHTIKIPAK